MHPLVNLWFFLGFSTSLLFTEGYFGWLLHIIIFLSVVIYNYKITPLIIYKIIPYIYYFPLMLSLYVLFSLFLTDNSLQVIIFEAIYGFLRLILMVVNMMYFFEITPNKDIVILLRSIWIKFNLEWKWVENFFLFLSLTLRYYPTFQSNWDSVRNNHKMLGLEASTPRFKKIIMAANEMPGLLIHELKRANDISIAMKLRGYGNQFPRGVTYPIPFNWNHGIMIFLITFAYFILFKYATI
jgi:energy-coupling factor transporter transmembrane protein EcfT